MKLLYVGGHCLVGYLNSDIFAYWILVYMSLHNHMLVQVTHYVKKYISHKICFTINVLVTRALAS